MFLLLFLLFSNIVFAQVDYTAEIEALESQAHDLLNQREILINTWKESDPDIILYERIMAKNDQQRALADQADNLLNQANKLKEQQKEAQLPPKPENTEIKP